MLALTLHCPVTDCVTAKLCPQAGLWFLGLAGPIGPGNLRVVPHPPLQPLPHQATPVSCPSAAMATGKPGRRASGGVPLGPPSGFLTLALSCIWIPPSLASCQSRPGEVREGGGPRCDQGPKQPSASSPSEQRSMTGSRLGRAGLRGVEGHPSSSSVPTMVSPMYARVYMYL